LQLQPANRFVKHLFLAQIATTFQQLAGIAASLNLFGPWTRSFAIYYDDPSGTLRDALRSDASRKESHHVSSGKHRNAQPARRGNSSARWISAYKQGL
jgi:hypothetical protein